MTIASLTKDLAFKDDKPSISVLMETDFTKELRIAFRKGQVMKEHQTPYPIVVQIVEGKIDFGANGKVHRLETGDLIGLSGAVPHDLSAITQSVVRLTLSTQDRTERVKAVVNQ